MVIGEGWPPEFRGWILPELFHHHFDCLLQLRILSLSDQRRIFLDFDVWPYSNILYLPLTTQRVVNARTGNRRKAAIHKWRTPGHSHQTTPGTSADQLARAR